MSRSKSDLNDTEAMISDSYNGVLSRIKALSPPHPVRVVAVSKKFPLDKIIALYKLGHRHFGENYFNELEEKANDPRIPEHMPEIKWHFIGTIQSNKVKKLVKIPNLWCVETVASKKVAGLLQEHTTKAINVMLQVNISEEQQKGGCNQNEVLDLAEHIVKQCPRLSLLGLMMIGEMGTSGEDHDAKATRDFTLLRNLRELIASNPSLTDRKLELSMGMSSDFELAIRNGSTNIRVGSVLFGQRPPKEPTGDA